MSNDGCNATLNCSKEGAVRIVLLRCVLSVSVQTAVYKAVRIATNDSQRGGAVLLCSVTPWGWQFGAETCSHTNSCYKLYIIKCPWWMYWLDWGLLWVEERHAGLVQCKFCRHRVVPSELKTTSRLVRAVLTAEMHEKTWKLWVRGLSQRCAWNVACCIILTRTIALCCRLSVTFRVTQLGLGWMPSMMWNCISTLPVILQETPYSGYPQQHSVSFKHSWHQATPQSNDLILREAASWHGDCHLNQINSSEEEAS
jgi:hypothetical protein